jgi:adenylate cyclase
MNDAGADRHSPGLWDKVLIDGHGSLVKARHAFRYLPSAPRCKLCNNPFGGPVGRVFAAAGFRRSRKNPNLCRRCCDALPRGGAEVDIAVLFADVRGSTALGHRRAAADFAALLNRFYSAATQTLLRHDAVIDKLIGDEVMAFFVPGISGRYRQRAVEAGVDLLKAVGYGTQNRPWLDVGVAVNAGVAYVGNVGDAVVDFTALGRPVNAAARMQQSAAAGGELLIASGVANELTANMQRRTLNLRGQEEPINVFVQKF